MSSPCELPGAAATRRASGSVATPWRAVALAGLTLLAACGPKSRPEAPLPALPTHGGSFRMAQDTPASLDPACLDDVYEATVINQIFDGLLRFDGSLNIVPCVADLWEVSPDGLVYTFHLKPGVRFHDGSEVTADDVVYSFSRIFKLPPESTTLAREYLGHILGTQEYAQGKTDSIAGLQALGDYDLRIELAHPFASFLAVVASDPSRIVPRRYVERVGDARFGREPVGCGPFRLARWSDKDIVLVADPGYHLQGARLDSLCFELPGDKVRDYAAAAFFAGRLSAALVPQGRLAEFQSRPGARILTRQELSLTFIGLNQKRPPFDDVRVRQAFACAIDRDEILRQEAAARVAPTGILPPGMPGYTPTPKLLQYDPERSRALLAAAGYPEGRGLPRIVFTTASQTQQSQQILDALSRQLAAVGIRLEIEKRSWLDFSSALTAQKLQCFTVTWLADIPDPDSILYPLGQSEGSANFANYRNPRVDSLLSEGRGARFGLGRMKIYRTVERLLLDDAAVVPLFHPLQALAVQETVRGVHMTPMGIGNIAMEEVWLQTALLAEKRP